MPALAFEKCAGIDRHTCVVDGDTIWLNGEKIRIVGYDTPEPTSNVCGGAHEIDLAHRATARLIELMNQGNFTVERQGNDRYGRTLAKVHVNDRDVGDLLVAEGLARYWPYGREFWCE